MDLSLLAFLAPVVFLAYATEVFLGFGAAVVAVSLGSQVYPLDQLVPVLAVLNVFVTGYVALRHRREVAWSLLWRRVLPRMVLGAALGLLLFPLVAVSAQKKFYLAAVGLFALGQLVPWPRRPSRPARPAPAFTALGQVAAGAAQALYSSGGPLLVLSLGRLDLDKGGLRSTLCAVWAGLNSLLAIYFALAGRLGRASLVLIACLLPMLPLGVLAGEWLHKSLPERHFRLCLWWLLVAAAALGLWANR